MCPELNELPECDESIGVNWKLMRRSIVKTLPFVYSSVERNMSDFYFFQKLINWKDLGLLGIAMNGTAIMEI